MATRVTWRYRVLRGGYRWFTGGNRGLQSYRRLQELQRIKWSYRGLQGLPEVTRYYGDITDGLQGVTGGYRALQGVTRVTGGYKGLLGLTGSSRGLQGVTGDYSLRRK